MTRCRTCSGGTQSSGLQLVVLSALEEEVKRRREERIAYCVKKLKLATLCEPYHAWYGSATHFLEMLCYGTRSGMPFYLGMIEGKILSVVLRESRDIANRCGRLFYSIASIFPPQPRACRK